MQLDRQYKCENLVQFLKYLFEFYIRTKIQSHIKSHISIGKHIKKEISKLKFKIKSHFKSKIRAPKVSFNFHFNIKLTTTPSKPRYQANVESQVNVERLSMAFKVKQLHNS